MAQHYEGDPFRVESSAEAADLLSYTAQLPPAEFQGALVRFADEFGGNLYWIYYIIVETPQTHPWTIRRVTGMSGGSKDKSLSPEMIRSLSNDDLRKAVRQIQSKYRGDASLIQARKESVKAKQKAQSRDFVASGTIRVK